MSKIKRLLLHILLLTVVVLFGTYTYGELETNSMKNSKAVKMSTVKEEDINERVKLEGTVVPRQIENIYANERYTVDQVLVDIGDRVKKGDDLVRFTEESLNKLKDKVEVVEVDINNIKLELKDLDSGSLKLDLDSRMLEIEGIEKSIKILERKVTVLKSELENLEAEAGVKTKLYDDEGISSLELNEIITKKSKKSIELEDSETKLLLLKEKYSLELMSYERLKRELDMKRIRLQGELTKYELSRRQLNRKLLKGIKSEIDGVVVEISVENGSHVSEGTKMISLAQSGGNIVEVNLPIKMTETVEEGMRAKIISKNVYGDEKYHAKVEKVSKVVKDFNKSGKKRQLVEVTLEILSEDSLKPGSKVAVEIFGKAVDKIKVVDAFSVLEEDDGDYVFVIEENRVRKKEIELGLKTLSKYQVLDLEVGDEIITNPFTLKVGDPLRREGNFWFINR